MTFEATPLNIALILLAIAGIWAIVELAMTLRKARASIDDLLHTTNDTLEQVQPIIGKVDGLMDDIQPEVAPLMENLNSVLGESNTTVTRVNEILGDVSSVSDAASSFTTNVKAAADGTVGAAVSAVGRLVGIAAPAPNTLADASVADPFEDTIPPAPADNGYVTYASVTAADEASAADAE